MHDGLHMKRSEGSTDLQVLLWRVVLQCSKLNTKAIPSVLLTGRVVMHRFMRNYDLVYGVL